MNKRIQILIHVAVWLVMFLSPMMFINHGRGITSSQFLVMCTVPLSFIVVFYMNYLWLTPHHFTRGHHRFYLLVNVVVIVILGIWVHLWVTYMHTLYDPDFRETDHWLTIGFILRDIFNLTIAAAVATTIRLAMRWQKAETARKDAEAAQMDALDPIGRT